MDRLRKPIRWLSKLTAKKKNPVYDGEFEFSQEFGLLSRPPMTNSRIESPEPTAFPETLTGGTAQRKATADILRDTLRGRILLDDHPSYWDRRFFDTKAINYFAPVFSRVCLFPPEEREAVMEECGPLFERLEASIRDAADSISAGEMTCSRNSTARVRSYLDKLTDLHMTRLDVVKGRYDDRMKDWREDRRRVSVLEVEREGMRGMMLGTVTRGYHFIPYSGYKAYSPEEESKYAGQWLESLG
ncbi:unnamed protein product [Clonostachys solani]|uniref:Uncharacterized protein n=1 Tax=Clonostachys solani TaxID=160281 RepID=A0A9N9ZG55_9HYPO|nr:unnamed protein product [Clonostachys solani]